MSHLPRRDRGEERRNAETAGGEREKRDRFADGLVALWGFPTERNPWALRGAARGDRTLFLQCVNMGEGEFGESAAICCPSCGYDLCGHLPEGDAATLVCPECGEGTDVERSWRMVDPPQPSYRINWRWWALAVTPAFSLILCMMVGTLLQPGSGRDWLNFVPALVAFGAPLWWGKLSWDLFRDQPTPFRVFWLVPHVVLLVIVNAVVFGVLSILPVLLGQLTGN